MPSGVSRHRNPNEDNETDGELDERLVDDGPSIDIGPPTANSSSLAASARSARGRGEADTEGPDSASSLGPPLTLSVASLAALSSPNSSAFLSGIRKDPTTGDFIGKNGKRVDPIHIYDRKIHCPDYLFDDKVVSPLFRNIFQRYSVAYFRPCVLRRTATGSVDNHVVRCLYIDAAKQQVQFVEENGQAKRAFNIQDVALIAVEKPAKSILGVSLAPTMGVVLKSSPAIRGSKLAAESHKRALKIEAERAAKEEKKRQMEEKKAAKLGLPPPPRPPQQTSAPNSARGNSSNAEYDGDNNDLVLRFEPFPPAKPPKGAPSLTPDQVKNSRIQSLQDATTHMNDFITLLKHFNPFIVTRNGLPHGIISRMPLQLSKPPGKPDPPPGPPDIMKSEPTEEDMCPPEEDFTEEDEPEADDEIAKESDPEEEEEEEEEEEVTESDKEEELEIDETPPPRVVTPPPPPPPKRPPSPELPIDYLPPPPLEFSEVHAIPFKFEFSTRPHEEYLDAFSYPKFPNYFPETTVRDLFVEESSKKGEENNNLAMRTSSSSTGKEALSGSGNQHAAQGSSLAGAENGEESLYDPVTDPLTGPPLLVAGAVPAFPTVFDSTFMGDDEASRCTALTCVASDVLRCAQSYFKKEKAKARERRRDEAWLKKTRLAASAGLPLPTSDDTNNDFIDPYYDDFCFNSDEEAEELGGVDTMMDFDPLARYLASGLGGRGEGKAYNVTINRRKSGAHPNSGSSSSPHLLFMGRRPSAVVESGELVPSLATLSFAGEGAAVGRGDTLSTMLPLPKSIAPPDPRDIYNGLQSPYVREDSLLLEDLDQRRKFIEGQLDILENSVLPSLIERRRRADELLEEMASAARSRGARPLGPTTRLAGHEYDRHLNLAVIVFDICRVRRQRAAYEAAMERERAAGVVPSAYKHMTQGIHGLL